MKFTETFEQAKIRARIQLQNTKDLLNLNQAVEEKIQKSKEKISHSLDDLYTLLRLVAAYAGGEYREIAIRSMVSIVAALIYFLSPMDAIPDFVTGFGFIDDMAVLAFVIKTFKQEIDRFIVWEMEGKDVEHEN